MRNINELIGIIKAINFDGIINQMEIEKLQLWVDKNRNLIFDKKQSDLIKLIDEVIEDKIITEDEYMMLLEYCKNNLNHSDDSSAIIYELNGIIEGIICDNEVNRSEIFRLKAWMDKNENIVRQYKPTASICKMIDDILKDGIVTEEEQEQLLQMLSAHINDIKFETKIVYLCNCVHERKNIGIDLIDLLDNEDAIEEIHSRAERELLYTLNSYSGTFITNPEIVFVSLVLIAMLHYDGSFYDYVRDTYKKVYSRYSEQKVEGLIRSIINRYRSVEERKVNNSRIINVVLLNTVVPSYYLASFFEFIYDIYKLNFEYELSQNIYQDFKFAFEGLRASILADSDDIQLNVTRKTYKLIKTTKQLILDPRYIDSVIKLAIMVVKLIDKREWNKEVKIYNPYLKNGYEAWIKTYNKDSDTRKGEKSGFYSRWEPKFMLDGNKVYLMLPTHRVKLKSDYRNIRIQVINGEDEIYCNQSPDIREIIGGYQININRIEIDKPLGKLSYRLLDGNEIIYDSKRQLNREFLVFDVHGFEIHNNTAYTGTAVFCLNPIMNHSQELQEYYKTDMYSLNTVCIKEGDAILLENSVFNFSPFIKPGIIGEVYDNYYIQELNINKKIPLYKSVNRLIFECENFIEKIIIIINDKKFKIDDFKYTVSSREGVNKFLVSLDQFDTGIYRINVLTIENGKKENLLNIEFAVDKNLNVKVEKNGTETYIVLIESELLRNQVLKEIVISDFEVDWLKFIFKSKEYIYYIPFDFNIYRVDDGRWCTYDQPLWIGDIKQDSVLEIYGCNYDEVGILTSDGRTLEDISVLKNKGLFIQVPLGFLTSYKVNYDYEVILFLKEGHVCNGIYCYNKCVLDEEKTEILYNNITRTLDVLPRYYGKGNIHFKIISENGEEIYMSRSLEDGIFEKVYNLKSFINYTIIFFEREKGLSLKKERNLKEISIIFYDHHEFVGKAFKIREVYFDQLVKGEFQRKNHYFNNTYIYFIKIIGDAHFIGEVYANTFHGKYWLNNINPVEIEICSDVINGLVELSITKEGDGLLMDFEHHGILNSIDNVDAVDIYSYSMEIQKEELI